MVLRRPQPSQGGQSSLYCRRGSSDASGACTMSKSAKIYGTLTLVLIGFPLFLTFWSGASAIMAILLIGAGSYTIAVCLLVASLWHRYRRGAWPIEIGEEPPLPRPYPYRATSPFPNPRPARAGNCASPVPPSRVNPTSH